MIIMFIKIVPNSFNWIYKNSILVICDYKFGMLGGTISTSHLFLLNDQDFQVTRTFSWTRTWLQRILPRKLQRRTRDLSLLDPVKRASLLSSSRMQFIPGVWRNLLRQPLLGKLCRSHPNSKTRRHSKMHPLGWMKFKTSNFNLQSARLKTTTSVTLLCPHQRGRACPKLKLSPPKLLSCQLWWRSRPL